MPLTVRPLINAAAALRERVTSKELAFKRLRLGLGESVAATVGPWFVRRMNEKVASLTVYSELSRPLARRLEAGALDVIVCAGPGLEGDAWRRLPAYREDFLLVTAKGVRMPQHATHCVSSRRPLPLSATTRRVRIRCA